MKHSLVLSFLLITGVVINYYVTTYNNPILAEPVETKKIYDDFILHIRVEKTEEGFQVLRSLEFKGAKPINIIHRTPFISISIDKDRHRFTGNKIIKTMDPGDVYVPQGPQSFPFFKNGDHTLFIQSHFFIDGEVVNIKAEEEIEFN